MFSRSRNRYLTFLLSYHVRVTSKIQINFRYRGYLKVLMIVSYKFLKFLHYLCFRGQRIHFWYSYWTTMFGWPRKSRSTSGAGGTQKYWWLYLIDFHTFFGINVFQFKESISDIPTDLLVNSEEISKIYKTQSSVPSSILCTGSWSGFQKFLRHNHQYL